MIKNEKNCCFSFHFVDQAKISCRANFFEIANYPKNKPELKMEEKPLRTEESQTRQSVSYKLKLKLKIVGISSRMPKKCRPTRVATKKKKEKYEHAAKRVGTAKVHVSFSSGRFLVSRGEKNIVVLFNVTLLPLARRHNARAARLRIGADATRRRGLLAKPRP